ncbi:MULTISPECIES: DUF3159 domain-containing protein [Streptomyces]|uniref:DUF3159 domain-containing protein n=1 Tax=Streptomyces TaxID=1883 RepID=UPI000B18DFE4|nr:MULTISPECIES: DUF3159 domain-containing protein [Streptomyces]
MSHSRSSPAYACARHDRRASRPRRRLPPGNGAGAGSAKDFFLLGIWVAFAGFLATFGSVLFRRPLTGVAWNLLHGGTHAWREDRQVLRAHDIATLAAALVLGSRFVVKQWLYVHDATGWLAVAKIAMGTP